MLSKIIIDIITFSLKQPTLTLIHLCHTCNLKKNKRIPRRRINIISSYFVFSRRTRAVPCCHNVTIHARFAELTVLTGCVVDADETLACVAVVTCRIRDVNVVAAIDRFATVPISFRHPVIPVRTPKHDVYFSQNSRGKCLTGLIMFFYTFHRTFLRSLSCTDSCECLQ